MRRTIAFRSPLALPFSCALTWLCFFALARLDADESTRDVNIAARQKTAAAILEKHCVECHGGRLTRSQFDLTTREGLLKGGDAGLAIVAGDTAKSPLYERVTHALEPGMPYKRKRLGE